MLSKTSRLLSYICAALYGILGVLLYVMPEQLASVFAWKVTAFMELRELSTEMEGGSIVLCSKTF